jgi:hypothetical protein
MLQPASLRSDPLAAILGSGGRFPSEQTAGISGIGIEIDKIIKTDRNNKEKEGDLEGTFDDHMDYLKDIGFSNVTWIFQDNRYGALLAIKSND